MELIIGKFPVKIELGSNIVSQIKILKSLNINLKQLKNEIQFIPNKILLSKRIILFSNGQKHYRYKWEKL
jgi:hypothetical protein